MVKTRNNSCICGFESSFGGYRAEEDGMIVEVVLKRRYEYSILLRFVEKTPYSRDKVTNATFVKNRNGRFDLS